MRKTLSLVALVSGVGLLAASALGSVSQAPPPGTFRLGLAVDIDYVDPSLAYYAPTWALMYATGAQLYGYPDAPAPRGSRLLPEVAAGYPRVSRDGRVYTIRLKRTYWFSNGIRVTAANFAWAINRALQRRMTSPAQPFIEAIVGAKDVIQGRARLARGVRTPDPYTLQLRLERRTPDILARLAMPFFQAIPRNLPINLEGLSAPVASAGPYFIKEWTRNRRIVLERNRFYRGPRPRRVRRIQVDIGLPLEAIKRNIDRGIYDAGDVPLAAHAELGRRYGVRHRSPGRYFANPMPSLVYLAFNHDRPLFGGHGSEGNVRLKQAVNYAIDRTRIVRTFGAYGAVANDQLLPPTLRGFRNAAIYPSHPDLTRARARANGHTRSGTGELWCSFRSPWPQICQIVQANLREIGLSMNISLEPRVCGVFCFNPRRRGEQFDIFLTDWRSDFHDPGEFVQLVDGKAIGPFNSPNASYFDDPGWNRRIARANALSGVERYRAFGRLDREIMRAAAPVAPIATRTARVYVASRVGCYHHHPVYGWDYPAVCLRR